jgi:asparagine synthase (glutamine-hydrolysing)
MSRTAFDRPWHPPGNPTGLTELEVASGVVVGGVDGAPFPPDAGPDPMAVLARIAAEALATPPCVVAFSGGRDSSALLAVLADVARREGLPPPVAVTARWDDDEASDESIWQELVIEQVGVGDWEVIRPGTDLDLLGTGATDILDRGGLMWPPPAYALAPMIAKSDGGVFLSGEGGDEAFGLWPYGRLWSTVRSRHLPRQSDLRGLALGCSPRAVRRWRWQHNLPPYQSWLRPEAFRRVAWAMADERADDSLRWDHYQVVSRDRRAVELTERTLQSLCALAGSRFVAPFLDRPFLSSLAAWGGALGRGDRTEVMTALFAGLLPDPVLSRTSKASFGGVFWGPESRRFAEEWDGTGLDDHLVDAAALCRAWLEPVPVYGSALPLHAAWLATRGARSSAA